MKRNWQAMDFSGSAMLRRIRREFGLQEAGVDSQAIVIRKPFSFKFNARLVTIAIIITVATCAIIFSLWGPNGILQHLGLLSK
jgi:hypothetical protein